MMNTIKNPAVTAASLALAGLMLFGYAAAEEPAVDLQTTMTLEQACEAYHDAKQSDALTSYAEELAAMVSSGQLTQEAADLLLKSAQDAIALQNGVCPNCGYELTDGKAIRGGKGTKKNDRMTDRNSSNSGSASRGMGRGSRR